MESWRQLRGIYHTQTRWILTSSLSRKVRSISFSNKAPKQIRERRPSLASIGSINSTFATSRLNTDGKRYPPRYPCTTSSSSPALSLVLRFPFHSGGLHSCLHPHSCCTETCQSVRRRPSRPPSCVTGDRKRRDKILNNTPCLFYLGFFVIFFYPRIFSTSILPCCLVCDGR
ncbi:hypothetical protein F4678DRAFT_275726 [Xylaria arbuscula]|nr:hypothetical protein F4678DRAFT_275726 [Xylaria arbuscula]